MDKAKLQQCRFFKGEASCPLSSPRSSVFFWVCERQWCNRSDAFSKELKELKAAGWDELAFDTMGKERIPLSLLALFYAKAGKGWSVVRLARLYTGLDPAGSYALIEKIPTSLRVGANGGIQEVEDDSWWQSFLASK